MADQSNEARAKAQARQERMETAAREGREAMAEHVAKAKAVEEKTARLRELRLAKEAAEREAAKKPAKKAATPRTRRAVGG